MRNNVQRWLSPSNMQADLHRHQLKYMPGCDWILEVPQAHDCLNSKQSSTVRILGRPGTGKTVLASFSVNHLAEQKEKNVVYFFCKAGGTEKRETTHILRTQLSQVLHIDQALYRDVEPLYTKSGRATADFYVDVYAALLLTLSKPPIDARHPYRTSPLARRLPHISTISVIIQTGLLMALTLRCLMAYGMLYISFASQRILTSRKSRRPLLYSKKSLPIHALNSACDG